MSYNKRTWANGNVVGAVDLNRMEQGVEDAFGYTYTSTRETLFEGEVTTVASDDDCAGEINYSEVITADTIYVTFNGTGYECNVLVIANSFYVYGGATASGPDYSQYPFAVDSSSEYGTLLHTETAGTYSLKIEAINSSIEVSEDFEKAVQSVSSSSDSLLIEGGNAINDALNHTFAEIRNAMASGNGVIFHFVPTQATEFAEFYTQNIRVVNSSLRRQVIVQYGSSDEVTYTASSDDAYPAIN